MGHTKGEGSAQGPPLKTQKRSRNINQLPDPCPKYQGPSQLPPQRPRSGQCNQDLRPCNIRQAWVPWTLVGLKHGPATTVGSEDIWHQDALNQNALVKT